MTENKKIDTVTLRREILETLADLKDLEPDYGIPRSELIEIAKLASLHEIIERIFGVDQTIAEIEKTLSMLGENIDSYIAERIDSDKVVLGILREIEQRAIVVELSQRHFDQGNRIAALEEKLNQFTNDH